MRTEAKSVTKIEFQKLPEELITTCLVPMPPKDADGILRYTDLPIYLSEVLGILEECNIDKEELQGLDLPSGEAK